MTSSRKQHNCLHVACMGTILGTVTLRLVVLDLRSRSALRGKMAWLLVTAFLERCSATTSVLRCLMAFNVCFCSAVKPSSLTPTARPCISAYPAEHSTRRRIQDFAGRLCLHGLSPVSSEHDTGKPSQPCQARALMFDPCWCQVSSYA